MTRTLADYRNDTRNLLQIDLTELPDQLIDSFAREGAARILSRRQSWPHLEGIWTLTAVSGQRDYPISALTPAVAGQVLADPRSVIDMNLTGGEMEYMSAEEARRYFFGSADVSSTPWAWSFIQGSTPKISLWPKPSSSSWTFEVYGQRTVTDWVALGVGASPDLPVEYHDPLWYWVISRAYMQQEDPEMASAWQQAFEEAVAPLNAKLHNVPHRFPLQLGGGRRYPWRSEAGWLNAMARG